MVLCTTSHTRNARATTTASDEQQQQHRNSRIITNQNETKSEPTTTKWGELIFVWKKKKTQTHTQAHGGTHIRCNGVNTRKRNLYPCKRNDAASVVVRRRPSLTTPPHRDRSLYVWVRLWTERRTWVEIGANAFLEWIYLQKNKNRFLFCQRESHLILSGVAQDSHLCVNFVFRSSFSSFLFHFHSIPKKEWVRLVAWEWERESEHDKPFVLRLERWVLYKVKLFSLIL